LSLALRIEQASAPAARDKLLATVPALFRGELEPHFQAEEDSLLPQLAQAGETALVARTLDEHAQLRALAAAIAGGDAAALAPFGSLLRAHVRFEERELFATAERLFSAGAAPDGAAR
jgi:hemerythrin-like domain-containing protein